MTTLEISQIIYKYLIQYKRTDMQLLTNMVQNQEEVGITVRVIYENKKEKDVSVWFKKDATEQEIKNDILAMYVDYFYFV
jgi:hypothetical protein